MTKTEKYRLPQWELSDRILMEDFNEAMSNIEDGIEGAKTEAAAGLAAAKQETAQAKQELQTAVGSGGKTCRIATGSYKGNGKSGSNSKISLTFDFKPYFVVVGQNDSTLFLFLVRGNTDGAISSIWDEKKVSWYSISSASDQKNSLDTTYYYVAIGESLK